MMSRSATRARQRRARIQEQIEAGLARVRSACTDDERSAATAALIGRFKEIAGSRDRLWEVVEALLGDDEDGDMLRAIVAQIVAAPLAGTTPGSVYRRHARAKE